MALHAVEAEGIKVGIAIASWQGVLERVAEQIKHEQA